MWVNLSKEDIELVIKTLRRRGRDDGDGIQALADNIQTKLDEEKENAEVYAKYRNAAHECFGDEGCLEFDDGAIVSIGDDDGAYVMGWRWVSADEAGVETNVQKAAKAILTAFVNKHSLPDGEDSIEIALKAMKESPDLLKPFEYEWEKVEVRDAICEIIDGDDDE